MTDFSLSLNEDQLAAQGVDQRLRRRTSCVPPPRSGTSARSSRGRSCRRPPRSASTAWTSWRRASPTRPASPWSSRIEEMFWGDAGIGLSIIGSGLAAAAIAANGTARAALRVGAAVLRHRRQGAARRASASPSPTPAPTSAAPHPGRRTTRPPTSGCSTAPRRGSPTVASPTSTWSSPSVEPELRLAWPRQLRRAARHHGPLAGPEVQEARHPRLAHRRGRARRRAGPRQLPARRQGASSTPSSPRPARTAGRRGREAAGDGHVRGHPPHRRRHGRRHRPRRLRVLAASTPRTARRSASRSS